MRRRSPSVQLLLNFLHLPSSMPHVLPATPRIAFRNPNFPEPTPPPPPPAQALRQNPSCVLLSQALSICAVLTPGFVTLLPPAQAHCLCYSSTVWVPEVLDDAVKTCADYASTAAPGAFGPLLNLEGFCMSVGDVNKDVPASLLASNTAGNGNVIITSNYVLHTIPTLMTSYGGSSNEGGEYGGSSTPGDGLGGSSSNTSSVTGGSSGMVGKPASTTASVSRSGSISSTHTVIPSVSGTTTLTTTDITITVSGVGATKTGDGAVRSRGEVTEAQVVLVSLAIAVLILFL